MKAPSRLGLRRINIGSAISFTAIIQNLPDALFGDAKYLSQRRDRLTFLVTGTDLNIARAFGGSAIGDRKLREF
jgi:hypothetical protein